MSTALYTDHYEFTMLRAALAAGTAHRTCAFELFARRLPPGRRYGVVAGTERAIRAVTEFRFSEEQLDFLERRGIIGLRTAEFLSDFRFTGDIDGFAEGEVWFPYDPILRVTGTFAEAVLLETVLLSIYNHDCAVAAAASRIVNAAAGRPCIEMGTRRTHEEAAVAAARAAYCVGFESSSNLAAGLRYDIPTVGTAAHAFTLLHDAEEDAFAHQVATLGQGTTLLIDTYDVEQGVRNAIAVGGTGLGAVRIDSGDLLVEAHRIRTLLDELGATETKIIATSDIDEFECARLTDAPVDAYGVGTRVVTGSGYPTAEMVYKLVARTTDSGPGAPMYPVAKRASEKQSIGGRKTAYREFGPDGLATADVIATAPPGTSDDDVPQGSRPLLRPLMRHGEALPLPTMADIRTRHRTSLAELPAEALAVEAGEVAIPTRFAP